MSTAIQITPWGFVSSNPRSLGRVREGGAALTGQNPARALTGGWGKVVGKHHGVERNSWVAWVGAGTVGGGSSA